MTPVRRWPRRSPSDLPEGAGGGSDTASKNTIVVVHRDARAGGKAPALATDHPHIRGGGQRHVPIGTGPRRRVRNAGALGWRERALAVPGARTAALPLPMGPQLCSARKTPPRGDQWLHEIKWDGYRLLVELRSGHATLRSRGGLDWTAKFPALARALESSGVADACIDGELVALDDKGCSDFSQLQRALKAGTTDELRYLAFDLPALEGVDLRQAPLLARKQLLEDLLAGQTSSILAYSKHIVGHGEKVFEASRLQGVEGIVSKQVDAPYMPGRSPAWIKLKHEDTDEFVVVGYTRPKGSREKFGSLLMARQEDGRLVYAGRVGTGYDSAALEHLMQRMKPLMRVEPVLEIPPHATVSARHVSWVKPALVAEVAFRGWGKEGLLRQAAFKRLRDDKPLSELLGDAGMDVKITHPERIVYASALISKGEVADFYREVAQWMLGELVMRPLSLLRCPDGSDGACFFQKHHAASLGSAVKSIRLMQKDGEQDYLYIEDVDGLLALVQMNSLEFHPWGSRVDEPELPDRLIFDLDPAEGLAWQQVVDAARDVRARLRKVGLESFVRLTGGKGLHVLAPIDRGPSWDDARKFSEDFAQAMADQKPDRYVATMSKAKRTDRIFIDWLRNARGSTSVTSWSLRARPGAPVAVPLRWEELGRITRASPFDLQRARQRAKALRVDPWAKLHTLRQALPG